MNIKARFILDEDGKPEFVKAGVHKHYKIEMFVDEAPNAESVVYSLDPTFYDPTREVFRESDDSYRETITSYGDFDVKVTASGTNDKASEPLSKALASSLDAYPNKVNLAAIQGALEDIRKF